MSVNLGLAGVLAQVAPARVPLIEGADGGVHERGLPVMGAEIKAI